MSKIDIVTLPKRDNVFLTLYKEPDMTFVREIRSISLKQGINELQFSWLHTLIDPTSIEMIPLDRSDDIHIENIIFPSQMNQMAIWKINSTNKYSVPMQLSYLTSGLDWQAYYEMILSTDEQSMQLKGYVRINNHSGETYDDAKIYLVMGAVNMLQPIEKLSQNISPYGKPEQKAPHEKKIRKRTMIAAIPTIDKMAMDSGLGASRPEIKTDFASEYAVFEINKEDQLKNGWGKQLIFLQDQSVPFKNIYRFHPEKYGNQVFRLISFQNNSDSTQKTKSSAGNFPLPGGLIRIYRDIYHNQHFSYEGQARINDIPVGKEVEIVLGHQYQVGVEKKRMKYRSDHHQFDDEGNVTHWDEFVQEHIEVINTRDISVFIEIICSFYETDWSLDHKENWVKVEKIDQHSVKFSVQLERNTRKGFSYDVIIHKKEASLMKGRRMKF